ncbi:IL3RB protein, partial [Arenaria interpres]|nr:IL3RB protein [Arenaria interpres]
LSTIYICNHCIFFWSEFLFLESIPMKSLSCYNDYNSQVTCTWMEHSEAHALVGMILYQRDNVIKENKEMFCKRQTENDLREASDSYVHWVCHNTTDDFGIGLDDIYSFKPNKILQAELSVDLLQNGKDEILNSHFP